MVIDPIPALAQPTTARTTHFAFGVFVAVLLVLTLHPTQGESPHGIRLCVLCGEQALADLTRNVALFIPLGFLLVALRFSVAAATLFSFCLAGGIEIAQIWIPGRFAAPIDVAMNTLGGAIGAWLMSVKRNWLSPGGGPAENIAPWWSAAVATVLVGCGMGLAPAIPRGDLFAGWTPELGTLARYEGRVLSAQIEDVSLNAGIVPDSNNVRRMLATGSALRLSLEVGPAPARLAPIFHLTAGNGRDLLLVGIDDTDLIIRPRLHGDDARLSTPDLRFPGALGQLSEGRVLALEIARGPAGGYDVLVGETRAVSGNTLARGWSLLVYESDVPGWVLTLMDVGFLASLAISLAHWPRTLVGLGRASLLPLLALGLGPSWVPVLPTPPSHYVAFLAGLTASAYLRRSGLTTDHPLERRNELASE